MSNIKCPNCGASHYEYKYSMTTAVYYPPIYKDGVNTNPDGNTTTTLCRCCECNHNFSYQEQFGEIFNISDDGEATTIPVNVPINTIYAEEPVDMKVDDTVFEYIPNNQTEIEIPLDANKFKEIFERLDRLEDKIDILLRNK